MTATIAPPDESLRPALERLAASDTRFARAFEACGLPPERGHPRGLDGLVRIIAAQQVSAGAARAIVAGAPSWERGTGLPSRAYTARPGTA